MNQLASALTELRTIARSQGVRWDDPVPIDDVLASMRRYDVPVIDELVGWYHLCPPGTWVTPRAMVASVESTADGAQDLRLVAIEEFDDPEDRSAVLDWFPLTVRERGGIAMWTGAGEAPRPLVWRDELYELLPGTRYGKGLAALVAEWIDAWQTGRYVMGPDGRPDYDDWGDYTITLV